MGGMKKEASQIKRNRKLNNRHEYGNGHGKFGKKSDRILRMQARRFSA